MSTKKIALLLSGCGNQDGSEITESAAALIALSEAGAEYEIFAPDIPFKAKNFLTGETSGETRSVLLESARIARGKIRPLKDLHAKHFDGFAMPGGMGAALNLSTWAADGAACTVLPEVERVLLEFYKQEKPICAICIAPAVVAKVLGHEGVTIGNNPSIADEIEKTGAQFEECAVDDYVTDRLHRVITTPAYMYGDATAFQVFSGIRKAIRELVEIA